MLMLKYSIDDLESNTFSYKCIMNNLKILFVFVFPRKEPFVYTHKIKEQIL